MSINEKIYNVMCETESLEKDLIVGTGNNSYKAVGETQVLNMLKPLFKKYKLICVPKDGEIKEDKEAYQDSYGKSKLRAITQLKVFFTLIDIESGEEKDIVGFGNGADSQDKGSGKALTYAFKTALTKTFMMFSGEDTDNTHSDDIDKYTPIVEHQIDTLKAYNNDIKAEIVKEYKISNLNELDYETAKKIINKYKEK